MRLQICHKICLLCHNLSIYPEIYATSRMASLLGVGPLITHAKRMELQVGSKTMTGIFMDEDLICGQVDRHCANMLYQLDVEEGVTRIKGIQGIDNDLAFGREAELDHVYSPVFSIRHKGVAGMDYIPKGFADRLSAVSREDLDYALGDLLKKMKLMH